MNAISIFMLHIQICFTYILLLLSMLAKSFTIRVIPADCTDWRFCVCIRNVQLWADVVQLITALIILYIFRYQSDWNYINVVWQQHISGELKVVLFVIHIIIFNPDMFSGGFSVSCSCSYCLREQKECEQTALCVNFLNLWHKTFLWA